MLEVVTGVMSILWLGFIIYLVINRKSIPLNVFGVMLIAAISQPFLYVYLYEEEVRYNGSLIGGVVFNRALFLIAFFEVVRNKIRINKFLKQNLQTSEREILERNIDNLNEEK